MGGVVVGWPPVYSPRPDLAQEANPLKSHRKLVEGNFKAGASVVVVDDTITTGGSTLEAIGKIRADGGHVAFALVLVDRSEGGLQAIEASGVPVIAIFSRADIDAAAATS